MKNIILVAALTALCLSWLWIIPANATSATCAESCKQCITMCKAGLKHAESVHADKAVIRSLKDCILECQKQIAGKISGQECAKACSSCAAACESLHDKALAECIKQCNSCADCCSSN